MNELSRHIEILLLDNDCVIVPGFGGFVAHYIVAEYNEDVETFSPPMRTLGFNRQLQLNDSLLVQAYVEAYDISYPEALRRIETEVVEINAQIESEGCYDFQGVGVVSKLSDGRFTFEPCVAGVVTPSLYGLKSYIMPVMQTEADVKAEEAQPVALMEKAETKEVSAVENAELESRVEDEEYEEYDEEESGLFVSYRKMWYAAAAAVMLLLMPLAYNSLTVGRGSQNNAVLKSSVGDTGIEVASKIGEGIDKIIDTKHEGAKKENVAETAVKENAEETVEEKRENNVEEKKEYSIILASRVSKQGAKDMVASLARAGMNEAAVYEDGTVRRVVYGKYATEREAEKALRQLKRKDNRFEGTWVQKID